MKQGSSESDSPGHARWGLTVENFFRVCKRLFLCSLHILYLLAHQSLVKIFAFSRTMAPAAPPRGQSPHVLSVQMGGLTELPEADLQLVCATVTTPARPAYGFTSNWPRPT